MFSNMRIGTRLFILISTMTLIIALTGSTTLFGLRSSVDSSRLLASEVNAAAKLQAIAALVTTGYIKTANDLYTGGITWAEAKNKLQETADFFNADWKAFIAGTRADEKEFYNDTAAKEAKLIEKGIHELIDIVATENRGSLSLYMLNDLSHYSEPFTESIEATLALKNLEAEAVFNESNERSQMFSNGSSIIITIGLLVAVLLGWLIFRSITSPIKSFSGAIKSIADGDMTARTGVRGRDELGELGSAFDNLLDERLSTLAKAEEENNRLNDSIISLLEAVSELSDKNLTVKVPVAEDVTGPVADAMNLMAEETAQVLKSIRHIAEDVEKAATAIHDQGGKLSEVAATERNAVAATMEKLEGASKAMHQIAKLAQHCNTTAARASSSTEDALGSVTNTANGMNDIRQTISETEKRIKRLGERSQEISGIVGIINSIAERTHVLALNASMQAAAAGDAGRGFAVVADEVQRLAESSRQSTSEIEALVKNIQSETSETMITMNKTITQVVDGTDLAQKSGAQMLATQKTTAELAKAVEQIAKHSTLQAHASNKLRDEASQIVESTKQTAKELVEQGAFTDSLVAYSQQQLEAVRQFKLPA